MRRGSSRGAAGRRRDNGSATAGGYSSTSGGGSGGGAEDLAAKVARRASSAGKVLRDKLSEVPEKGFFRNMMGIRKDGHELLREEQSAFSQRRESGGRSSSTSGNGSLVSRGASMFRQAKAQAKDSFEKAAEKAAAAVGGPPAWSPTKEKSPAEVKLENICALGFSPDAARTALIKSGGNADLACHLLFEARDAAATNRSGERFALMDEGEEEEDGSGTTPSTVGGRAATSTSSSSSSSSSSSGSSSCRSSVASRQSPEEYLNLALQEDEEGAEVEKESTSQRDHPFTPPRRTGAKDDATIDDGRGLGTKRLSWVACPHALASARPQDGQADTPAAEASPSAGAGTNDEEEEERCEARATEVAVGSPCRPLRHSMPSCSGSPETASAQQAVEEEERAAAAEELGMDDEEEDELVGLMLPPQSDSWEWPMSRTEKKTRVHQLERHMQQLDKRTLMKELVELRVRWRKFEHDGQLNDK
eukprot:TRINITY_DN112146_c0_g1_i1.p1 TRINITY_DN112146_c0_g1~~TRINITY_DN112146_c0_g1_i1.p1  ORF type:complete len:507 (-),score=143.40 TRINITY_DN112146_c0_g1_i1:53-1480(-)